MTFHYSPLVSDRDTYVTNNTAEAAAYVINGLDLFDHTYDPVTDEGLFSFRRTDLFEATREHYHEGRLRGDLLAHDQQRQLLAKLIRHLRRQAINANK